MHTHEAPDIGNKTKLKRASNVVSASGSPIKVDRKNKIFKSGLDAWE